LLIYTDVIEPESENQGAVQQSTGANLPIRRQWTPEEREQLLTLERPPSAPTAEAKKAPAGASLAQ
jgi:hypothetical protein